MACVIQVESEVIANSLAEVVRAQTSDDIPTAFSDNFWHSRDLQEVTSVSCQDANGDIGADK